MFPGNDDGLLQASTASGDRIALSLHGGQLLSWVCEGRERLFVSANAVGGPGKSVRGGVPVIFPQFGLFGPGPKHGFARLQRWRPVDAGDRAALAAELLDSDATRAAWPHRFRLQVRVQAAERSLTMTLAVHNTGDAPFEFTGGLHGYLAVDALARTALHGLEGRPYLDCAGGARVGRVHGPDPLRCDGEVDRVYPGTDELLMIEDAGKLRITASAFTDTVVWNPGAGLAATMADLGAGQDARFLCVEAAVINRPVRLDPGKGWQATQHLSITDDGLCSIPFPTTSGDLPS